MVKNRYSLLLLLLTHLMYVAVSSFRGLSSQYDDYALYTILLKLFTTVLRSLENVRGLGILCYSLISGRCLFLMYNVYLLVLKHFHSELSPFCPVVPLPYGLELDISLPSFLHVLILILLIIMAGRHSWRGIYKVLIPHLVCLLWWQLFTELFRFTSWSSLLRATVGWVIFITMLPLLFLLTVGLALAYLLQWFMTLDVALKLAVTALVVAVSSALFYYSKLEIPHEEKLEGKKKPLMIAAGLVVFCLLVPTIYVNFVPSIYGSQKPLSWEEYYEACGRKASEVNNVNTAAVQIKCNEFYGESVNWTGTVAYVKLTSVENRFRGLVTFLPRFLRPTIKCLLGGAEESSLTDR